MTSGPFLPPHPLAALGIWSWDAQHSKWERRFHCPYQARDTECHSTPALCSHTHRDPSAYVKCRLGQCWAGESGFDSSYLTKPTFQRRKGRHRDGQRLLKVLLMSLREVLGLQLRPLLADRRQQRWWSSLFAATVQRPASRCQSQVKLKREKTTNRQTFLP